MLLYLFAIYQGVLTKDVVNHFADLVCKEWKGPGKQVKASWEVERLLNIFVLLDVHLVIFDEDNSTFVLVGAAVVWSREYCYD